MRQVDGRRLDRQATFRAGRPAPVNINPGRPGPLQGGSVVAWVYLVLAGALEIVWAYFMKKSAGFTLLAPSAITIVAMIASFTLLSISMRSLPLGTAYTVWTGIGAVGAFAVGVMALGEAATPLRLAAGALIVSGILLMKLDSAVS